MGAAAKLPPRRELDANAGEDCGGHQAGRHRPGLPPLAHLHAQPPLPRHNPPKRHQNDQRAARGRARQPEALLPPRPHLRPPIFREFLQAQDLQGASLWPLLRARRRAGAAENRAHRLEHPVRLRRRRPAHQRATAADVRGRERRGPVRGAKVRDRRVQLRWPSDGRQGPPAAQHHPRLRLLPRRAHREVHAPGLRDVLHPRGGRRHAALYRLHQHAPHPADARGVWSARERGHREGPAQYATDVRDAAADGRQRGRRGRRRRGESGGRTGEGHPRAHAAKLLHRKSAAQVPSTLRGEHESGAVSGNVALQPPPHHHPQLPRQPGESHRGAAGDERRAGEGISKRGGGAGARAVEGKVLSEPETARLLRRRPHRAPAHARGLVRARAALHLLAARFLLHPLLHHRRASKLRAPPQTAHRRGGVRL
mmetsp:Transcript_2549/g.4555  ORF Transcript_2549/g.4555 Transcript_2549/m.4555 type:complete len:425 (+) Transcript_2549:1007-2281(+)